MFLTDNLPHNLQDHNHLSLSPYAAANEVLHDPPQHPVLRGRNIQLSSQDRLPHLPAMQDCPPRKYTPARSHMGKKIHSCILYSNYAHLLVKNSSH